MKTEKPTIPRTISLKILPVRLPGGKNVDQPSSLSLKADLGNMPYEGSGWRNLLDAIEVAGKYVTLDLSACILDSTDFSPAASIETGKDKIVSIILPENAISIGLNPADGEKPAFKHFSNLKSVSGKGIERIAEYAFYDCKELVSVDFPSVKSIGEGALNHCKKFVSVNFPEAKGREISSEQMEAEILFANIDWDLVPTATEEEALKSVEEFLINLRSHTNG